MLGMLSSVDISATIHRHHNIKTVISSHSECFLKCVHVTPLRKLRDDRETG